MPHTQNIFQCLEDLGLFDCLIAAIPMNPCVQLSLYVESSLVDPIYYRVVVGKLFHLSNTCTDIVYAMGVCPRFTSAPYLAHLEATLHVSRHLEGTAHLVILYWQGEIVT